MKSIIELTKQDVASIKLICFDADGVTKKKGTDFVVEVGKKVMKTYGPRESMKQKMGELMSFYTLCVSSGRIMSYLRAVYGEKWILQSEIGMYTFRQGIVKENTQLTDYEEESLTNIYLDLKKLLNDPRVKGFEPKERIVTLHCREEVPEVERLVSENDKEGQLDCWWNGEAYDVLPKRVDKGFGLRVLLERLNLTWEQVMTVGNGINDMEMIDKVGLSVSTDKEHLKAMFFIEGEEKGGERLVDKLLELSRR